MISFPLVKGEIDCLFRNAAGLAFKPLCFIALVIEEKKETLGNGNYFAGFGLGPLFEGDPNRNFFRWSPKSEYPQEVATEWGMGSSLGLSQPVSSQGKKLLQEDKLQPVLFTSPRHGFFLSGGLSGHPQAGGELTPSTIPPIPEFMLSALSTSQP